MPSLATLAGLGIALGSPLILFSPLAVWLGDKEELATLIKCQFYLWSMAFVLLAVLLFWEKKPLSSVGFRKPRWRSLVLGVATAVFLVYVVTPIGVKAITLLNLSGFEAGLSRLRGLPLAYLLFAGITAGIVEELFYRGYAVERLTSVVGSLWLGGFLALLAFGVVHIPFWGLGPAIFTLFPGVVLTLLYLWQRDLVANMVAHGVTAIIQLMPYAAGSG